MSKWNQVFQYKNNYYAYKPCDYMHHVVALQNDSLFIIGSNYDFSYYKLKRNVTTANYEEFSILNHSNFKLKIYTINRDSGIKLYAITKDEGETDFFLMVNELNLKYMPIIVNTCKNHKQNEFKFEKVNYELLINSLK